MGCTDPPVTLCSVAAQWAQGRAQWHVRSVWGGAEVRAAWSPVRRSEVALASVQAGLVTGALGAWLSQKLAGDARDDGG